MSKANTFLVEGWPNVAATCADVLAYRESLEENCSALSTIKKGKSPSGQKLLDYFPEAPINQYRQRTETVFGQATNDYPKTANSDVVVITFRSSKESREWGPVMGTWSRDQRQGNRERSVTEKNVMGTKAFFPNLAIIFIVVIQIPIWGV